MPAPLGALPVVLISGCSPTPEYTQRAEALRAAALLRKPVSLENLLAAVARGLGQAPRKATPRSAAAREDAARAAEGEAGLAGSFDQLPFAALLHHLHGLRATGVLHLSYERKRKWLRLRDGYPIAVRSNLVNECLGNHLVRAGRITASELAESRRRMKGGELQGEILVAMDLLSEDEIAIALRAQAEEKLFEIFTWPNGEFRFETGGNLQRANDLSLERSPANLILEGVRTRLPLDAHRCLSRARIRTAWSGSRRAPSIASRRWISTPLSTSWCASSRSRAGSPSSSAPTRTYVGPCMR